MPVRIKEKEWYGTLYDSATSMPIVATALALLALTSIAVAPARAAEPQQPFFVGLGIDTVEGRQSATTAPLPDGRILIAGGSDNMALRSAETFDPVEISFEPVPHLTRYKRTGAVAAPLPDGRVLIAGGSNEVPYAHAEIFDPETEEFTDVEDEMIVGRSSAVAAPLPDGRVLIAGGHADGVTVDTAETFDPASETFTALPATMVEGRFDAVAAALPSGMALIVGGQRGGHPASSAEVFDPTDNRFEIVVPNLGRDVVNAAGAALPSGRVLIAGGTLGGFAIPDAAVVDPLGGSFMPLPNSGGTRLTTERNNAIAASLPDGKVLIAGGSWPEARSSADIFVPAPELVASGTNLGTQILGAQAAPATVVITSLGGQDLEIDAVTLAGPDAGDFAILADTCTGVDLDFEESCTLSVRFTPTRLGAAKATLLLDDNEPAPTKPSLTATGVAPFVTGPPRNDPPRPPVPQREARSVKCKAQGIRRSRRVRVTCRVNLQPGAWEARLRQRKRIVARRRTSGGVQRLTFRPLRPERGGFRVQLVPLQ